MFDKLNEFKNNAVDRIMNLGLIRGLQIASGCIFFMGIMLANLIGDQDLRATDILNDDSDELDVEDFVIEDTEE